jgi:acyl-CoA thioester hydrolase
MPVVFERSFQVRHYECDATGTLHPAVILRWMQESAYEASAKVGYGMVSYGQSQRRWLVKETEIEFIAPIYYEHWVKVRTWVEDFHRVRSIRAYEIYNPNKSEIAARAWSDWVYLDIITQQPSRVPEAMVKAFYPEWQSPMSRPRRKSTLPEEPVTHSYRDSRMVEWRDIDPVGHVNNSNYYAYLDECSLRLDKHCGWPHSRFDALGIIFRTQNAFLDYRHQIVFGERLDIVSWISDILDYGWSRHFLIKCTDTGAIVLYARFKQSLWDFKDQKVVQIPAHILQDYSPYIHRGENGDPDNEV